MEAALDIYRNARARENRDQLILDHLDHVRHILGRLIAEWPPGLDVENLEAAGILGLVQAADHFDPARGVSFKAFATQRIRGAVIDELRRNSPLPQEMLRRLAVIRQAFRDLGPDATIQQVAECSGLSVADVEKCLDAERLTRLASGEDAMRQLLQTEQVDHDDPQYAAEMLERKTIVAAGIEKLSRRERTAISLYYLEDLRLKEIGEVMGLSESRVSRVLTQAELRLAEYVRRRLE